MPATRSLAATPNDTDVTAPPITPDATEAEATWSALVCTDTAPPAVAAPMTKPLKVTVAAVLALAIPDSTVITMLDIPQAAALAVAPPLTSMLDATTPNVKNPGGYIRVMVLGAKSAPPAVGVKEKVNSTPVLFISRSALEMANATAETAPPMFPDGVQSDGKRSRLVETVTLPPAVGAAPMAKPLRVTVTTALAATVPDCNEITMLDAPLAEAPAVAAPLIATLDGTTPDAKNPGGYMSVMVPGTESAPPAVGAKPNINETPALLTTRLLTDKPKRFKLAEPPIDLDGTNREDMESSIVCKLTEPPAVGVPPIVKPDNVTVTAALAASVAVPLVMTMDVAPGAAAVRVAPPDTAADGVALPEKKPDG